MYLVLLVPLTCFLVVSNATRYSSRDWVSTRTDSKVALLSQQPQLHLSQEHRNRKRRTSNMQTIYLKVTSFMYLLYHKGQATPGKRLRYGAYTGIMVLVGRPSRSNARQ